MAITNAPRTLAELTAWQAQRSEAILEPGLPIIDAHHHLWWRPPESFQLPEMLGELRHGHDIRATVFVQCTSMYRATGPEPLRAVGETEYVNGMAAISASGLFGRARLCAGIVGYADLRLGDAVTEILEAHIRAGGGRFRGIRQQAQHDPHVGALARLAPPSDLLTDPDFLRGFARLAPLGLAFDAWIYFSQLADLATLADRFPETRIILNHIGAPLGIGPYAGRRAEVFDRWSAGMRALAERDNVHVKLGGLGMPAYGFGFEGRAAPPGSEALADAWRPYILLCIEAFGVKRCMFESNFPVDKQSCSYPVLWNAFKRIAADMTPVEKQALFHDTAQRLYRLDDIPA